MRSDTHEPAADGGGWVIAAVAGLAAAAAVLAATRLGAGATPDTGHYLATAGNLLEGRGFVRLGPQIMASWPPLYPTILAAFGLLGIDMLAGARILNTLALAVAAVACARWVGIRTSSLGWGAAAGAATALSPPLVYSASLALSDAPFACLQVLALWSLDAWLERPRRSTFAACAACIALACLMRYNGVVIVGTAILAVLALGRLTAAARLRHAVVLGLAGSAPLALWFGRNLWLTGTIAGPRVASEYRVADAFADAGYTVMSWLVPYRVLTTSRWSGLALLLALLAGLSALAWRHRHRAAGRTALMCLGFVALFLSFMIVTFTRVSVDPLASRMLAPTYIPLIVAAFVSIAATLQGFASRRLGAARIAVAGATLLVLAVMGARTAGIVTESWREGPGGSAHSNFNTDSWRASPTLRWAGAHLRDKLVFASAPAALYIATGATSRPMPRKHARRSPGIPHDRLPALQAEVAQAGEAYLLISHRHVPSHTFSFEELASAFVIDPVQRFDDGAVFRLRARTDGRRLMPEDR